MHMAHGADPARYPYAGEVFRRQERDPNRANEYIQAGYEVFDRGDPAAADAEVFALIQGALEGLPVTAVTGDIGILMAAVAGLDTSASRKAALMRHIWRPRRFRALLDRYAGRAAVPASRTALLASPDPLSLAGPMIGLRGAAEIAARVDALRADAQDPALPGDQVDLLEALVKVSETCGNALEQLRDIAVDMPAIAGAVERMAARCESLAAQGIDVTSLMFDANFGRTSMEYYDGFVFGFSAPGRPDWPLVASGGRYDALTRQLGQGREIPAVGGVIRPGLLVDLEEAA